MKHFLKRTAQWATVWTVLLTLLGIYDDLKDGKSINPLDALVWILFLWLVMFVLTLGFKFLVGLRMTGVRLGVDLVKNPRRDAGEAMKEAAGKSFGKRTQ